MTANELFESSYGWLESHAGTILWISILLPILGAGSAKLAKGGKTDADGKLIANILVSSGIAFFVVEFAMMIFAGSVLNKNVLESNAILLIAPMLYLGIGIAAIRWVFPLNQLGSVRQATDIGAFLLVCWGIVWLFGKFRWGIIFFGSLVQLVLILGIAAFFVRRLYKRALNRK